MVNFLCFFGGLWFIYLFFVIVHEGSSYIFIISTWSLKEGDKTSLAKSSHIRVIR